MGTGAEQDNKPNRWLVGFQHHFICGHKSQTKTQPKYNSAKLFDVLGSEVFCDVCQAMSKVIRTILFDVDSAEWLD